MQTIGIDCRFASTRSGLGRYTRSLVQHLLAIEDPASFILFVRSRSDTWLDCIPKGTQIISAPYPHYSVREQIALPSLIRKSKCSLFFSPHFTVPLFCPVPFVATIHDLILHRYPNQAGPVKRLAYLFLMRSTVRHARRLIAVSAFTAGEIASCYGRISADKITVIPEGVDPLFHAEPPQRLADVRRRYRIAHPFFLYVGNAKEHKNVQMLIDAFHDAWKSEMTLVLVMEGREAEHLRLGEQVTVLNDLPDEDLPALYSAARAFVTASLYEGFCLPILEALACDCPVIAPALSAIPEIVEKSGAVLIEPTMEALSSALRSPPMKTPGILARERYAWDLTARETLAVLHTASSLM
ncbi:MAG: glycosyltransferase family 1 protein [Candidatus Peregrinibacteria bacterium]